MKNQQNKRHFPPPGDHPGGFGVPDGYFDRLPGRIMENIRKRTEHPVKTVILTRRIYALTAAAAAFLILLGTGLWYRYQFKSQHVGEDENIMAAYYHADLTIDEETIYNFIDEEDLEITTRIPGIKDETIITYLLDEGIDNDMIAEHL
ncbi:MAG: hypothetical protein GXO83_08190 [Chlorobi bacterium]|nr:hypothetical protein [Chlorobiota bacterium]